MVTARGPDLLITAQPLGDGWQIPGSGFQSHILLNICVWNIETDSFGNGFGRFLMHLTRPRGEPCQSGRPRKEQQSAISGIFSDPSTTIAFCASDCRQAQVGRCSKAFKSIRHSVVHLDHTASHGMSILGKDCFKLERNSWCVIFICQVGRNLSGVQLKLK